MINRLRGKGLVNPTRLAAFLQGTARRLLLAHWRRERRENTIYSNVDDLPIDTPTPYENAVRSEEHKALWQALDQLPVARDRELLRRRYLVDEDSK